MNNEAFCWLGIFSQAKTLTIPSPIGSGAPRRSVRDYELPGVSTLTAATIQGAALRSQEGGLTYCIATTYLPPGGGSYNR